MARQSDKDKDKETPHEGARQQYESPEQECAPAHRRVILAKAAKLTGSLRVIVQSGTEPLSPVLEGVPVTIEGDGFHDTRVTDPMGAAVWNGLGLRAYKVHAEEVAGYEAGDAIEVDLSQGPREAHLQLKPLEATLLITAFHDADRCGALGDQELIGNVGFEVWRDGERLGGWQTEKNGVREINVQPGLLSIVPQASTRVPGRILTAAYRNPLRVQVAPGQRREVALPYVSGLGELRVSALLEPEDPDGETTEAVLPGVRLALYVGPMANGAPLRTATTQTWPCVFSDLQAGSYTLTVAGPPHYDGQAIELADPQDAVLHVDLTGGGDLNLPPIRFQRSLGRVEGSVRDALTQRGWAGVGLVLTPATGGPALHAFTGPDGDFVFTGVSAGSYDLDLADAKVTDAAGRRWVRHAGTPACQRIAVGTGKPVHLRPFLLTQEEHLLTVQVLDPQGALLPGTEVEILAEHGGPMGTYVTDSSGQVVVHLREAGTYRARVRNDGVTSSLVAVNEPQIIQLKLNPTGGYSYYPPPSPTLPSETVVDVPYPLLTEGAPMAGSSQSATGSTATADLGITVENTLREVLNWKSKGFRGNAKGFVTALKQSFEIRQIEGHTEFTWTPRSYTAQPDLGAITGAQASLYTRAKVALDQSLPLLDGLYPLSSDPDDQDVDAIRAIVRSGLIELVNELGVEGGPRVVRVDTQFQQLLDVRPPQPAPSNPEDAGGQLGDLAEQFGLIRDEINTIDEEQNLTNYLILVDYVTGLYQSWLTQRNFFTRSATPFLGTQLVLVSRTLAVVAESVQEVYSALDSVFVGQAERQVVPLQFDDGSSLSVAELLSWVEQAASVEGPRLLQEGGKAGVRAFQPTISSLAGLATEALAANQPGPLPAGYRSARVQRALQELAGHLGEASRLISQIQLKTAVAA